jgi:hypothetical protein
MVYTSPKNYQEIFENRNYFKKNQELVMSQMSPPRQIKTSIYSTGSPDHRHPKISIEMQNSCINWLKQLGFRSLV